MKELTKITSKSTKQEMKEAIDWAKKEIERLNSLKTDTQAEVKKKEVEKVKATAEKLVQRNILSEDIQEEYNALKETIAYLKEEIQQLYDIKAEANTLEAIINASKDKKEEITTAHNKKVEELKLDYEDQKKEINKKTIELLETYTEKEKELRKSHEEKKSAFEQELARQKEQLTYQFNRDKEIQNNEWEDEKAAREKVLADREAAIAAKEEEHNALLKEVIELREKLDRVPQEIAKAVAIKEKALQEKYEVEFAKQKDYLEEKAKWKEDADREKIIALEKENEKLRVAKDNTEYKLDEAYKEMRNLATEAVKSSTPKVYETNTKKE